MATCKHCIYYVYYIYTVFIREAVIVVDDKYWFRVEITSLILCFQWSHRAGGRCLQGPPSHPEILWIVFWATPGTSCPSLRLSPVINLFSDTLIQFLLGMNINVVESIAVHCTVLCQYYSYSRAASLHVVHACYSRQELLFVAQF